MGQRTVESGGTIKWIETIRPTTQEWSSGGFALLERVDPTGMFDGHIHESPRICRGIRNWLSGERKFVKPYQSGIQCPDFRLGHSFFYQN